MRAEIALTPASAAALRELTEQVRLLEQAIRAQTAQTASLVKQLGQPLKQAI